MAVFLTWITYLTGGVLNPFQALIYVHVIAISLLASYRTALKVAVWDSLLLLVIANGVRSGTLPEAPPLFGGATAPNRAWAITIAHVVGSHHRDRCALCGERAEPPAQTRGYDGAHEHRGRAGRRRCSRGDAGHPARRPPRCVRDRAEPRARFARGRSRAPRVERRARGPTRGGDGPRRGAGAYFAFHSSSFVSSIRSSIRASPR